MQLTVHRATRQIGGNCVEVRSCGTRLILDAGRPLDAPREASGLLPASLGLGAPTAGLLISHPHQDHYGLLDETPPDWPVYSGPMAARLMTLTTNIFGRMPARDYRHWASGVQQDVGPFRVTPLLTDHSAFDAYMLLIEAEGKRVLYSGDFRIHGRKSGLVHALMRRPPADLDALLLEGTNLGSDKPTATEDDLEDNFRTLFAATRGRVFVSWSAQNVDRTVTLYRACLQSGRTLVVDLYTAQVLELLAAAGRLPRPGLKNLKVVITRAFSRLYRGKGEEDFVGRMAAFGISAAALAHDHERWVVMIRPSLIRDFAQKGVTPMANDAWSFSQWKGYLAQPDGQRLKGLVRWRGRHTRAHPHVRSRVAARPKSICFGDGRQAARADSWGQLGCGERRFQQHRPTAGRRNAAVVVRDRRAIADMRCGGVTGRKLAAIPSDVRFGCAPCKGGAFQWVQVPPGHGSSRKQPERSWRQRND